MLHHLPRRWPKPGPRALAIAAMALVSAAVLPAMTITAAASPTPATTTVAKLSPDAGSRQVLMLNGDRLLVRPARDGALTTLLPARFGKAVLTLHIARTIYHIPVDALPYIGHGLDPSLFNLASLERAESAGRLPVQVSFAGAQRPLPGIKITSRDGRTAAGYLTTSSAKVFGAALYRQFIVDHATAGYANSPLFAGVHITLAGAQAAVPLRPSFPMHTLTVTAVNEFNRPDDGDVVLVINADNPNKFGDPIETGNIFFRGVAKYSVPSGHYWAITDFIAGLKNGSLSQRLVVLPQFTVKNSTKVSLSAHAASSEISVKTPRASTGLTDTWTVVRTSPHGLMATIATSSFGPVFISPTTKKPSVGTIQSFTGAQLISPSSAKGTPYVYNLAFAGPVGTIPAQHFIVTPGSLATVHERYFVSSPTSGSWSTSGGFLPQLGVIGIGIFTPEISMPGLQTQYMTGGRSIVWASSFFADNGAAQQDAIRTLLPGQQLTENWNQYPLHPQPFAQLLTGKLATIFSQVPSAFRTGNVLFLAPAPVSDNQVGHIGLAGFTSSFSAQRNGHQIAGGGFQGLVTLNAGAKPSVIRFALHVQQLNPLSVLSPATSTTWTIHTSPQPNAVIPSSWVCFTPDGNVTSHCAIAPMLTLNYQVNGLGLGGVAPAGQQKIAVTVGHIQLAAEAAITHADAQVSYDNGRFWHPATLAAVGNGKYLMSFSPPAGVDVTLRFTASDAAANSVTETILSAYSVGS
ncbi:MAG TPA: hypothetical protein VN695_12530 [Streptosporangiaceae bacterium]|nr:hypothetical protein [Streptosporangiaceae bacterium]